MFTILVIFHDEIHKLCKDSLASAYDCVEFLTNVIGVNRDYVKVYGPGIGRHGRLCERGHAMRYGHRTNIQVNL